MCTHYVEICKYTLRDGPYALSMELPSQSINEAESIYFLRKAHGIPLTGRLFNMAFYCNFTFIQTINYFFFLLRLSFFIPCSLSLPLSVAHPISLAFSFSRAPSWLSPKWDEAQKKTFQIKADKQTYVIYSFISHPFTNH